MSEGSHSRVQKNRHARAKLVRWGANVRLKRWYVAELCVHLNVLRHVGIGHRLTRRIRAGLATKVHIRILRAAGRRRRRRIVLGPHTFVTRPRLNEGAVDGKMLVRRETALIGASNPACMNASAICPSTSRSQFLLNTVDTHMASSGFSSTNQRNNW